MINKSFGINKFTALNTMLCSLLTWLNSFPLALTDVPCKNQGDCNNGKNDIDCGICINSDDLGTGKKCIFPFPFKFKDGPKCQKLTCEDINCSGHGNCTLVPFSRYRVSVYKHLIPGCTCFQGFYGRMCEYSIPKDKPGLVFPTIGFPFMGIRSSFKKITAIMYYGCSWQYLRTINFSYVVNSEDTGFYQSSYTSAPTCETYLAYPRYLYSRLPYKPFDRDANYKILQFENKVLGYLSALEMQVVVNGLAIQYKFAVFVSYEETNLVCIPVVIKLSGCATSWKYDSVFDRSNRIKISSSVIYIADGRYVSTSVKRPKCEEHANYHWTILNGDKTVLENYHIKDLFFDAYSLNFAKYTVLLEVTSMQEKPAQNFAYCYFSIRFVPIVAIIDGGSEMTVSKPYGIVLSTTRSQDPNMPPDKQGHMKASWSCVDVSNPSSKVCESGPLPVSNNYRVPSESLSYGAVYNITLKVWTNYYDNIGPVFDFVIITIANKTDTEEDYIYIQCLLNCNKEVVHTQQLYLRAKKSDNSPVSCDKFKWTYYEKGQTQETDTKNITVEGLASCMCLVKEQALSSGKSYIFVVRIENKKWVAKYAFKTQEVDFEGTCSITPTSGTKGLTLFTIVCQHFRNSPFYEFYDKTPEEAKAGLIFNGRMLGSSVQSNIGELKYFRVTRGHVLVYIIDNSGLYNQQEFIVDLLPWNVTEEVMAQIIVNITELFNLGESAKMLELVSTVPDIIPLEMNRKKVLNKLLHFITRVPTDTISDIKLTTSTLTNVLLTLNKPVQLALESYLMRDTLHIVRNQTSMLSKIVSKGTDMKGMSPDEIRLVATYQLHCLQAALMCKDPRQVGITEFDYDLKTLDELMDSSNFAEDALYLVKDILTVLQAPGQPPTKVSTGSAYTLWVVENDEEYNLTNYLSQYNKEIPVVVSNRIIKEFRNNLTDNNEELTVRVATLKDNIFWWSKSDIKSSLVSVSLATHSTGEHLGRIDFVENFIGLQVNLTTGLNSTQVKGTAMPYNSNNGCTLEKDLTIDIHRLDPEPKSLLTLKFLFPQTNGSLLVHIEKEYRPDCILMEKAKTINEQSPTYPPIISNHEEPTFYFVGIIPQSNFSVAYTFELNTIVCQFWAKGHWSSEGCRISTKTNTQEAYCECNHFSIFGAAFPVPPQEIDLFSDINLFLTVFDNPLVVSFVSIVLITYLICCVWAWRKDKKDRSLKNVIILDDNFPNDSFPYLLAVYTSSRFNAGTTAHVGITISGSLASSRPHILASKERKVLKRNYDDWFLLYCPEPLGDLNSIHLWHDNSGSSPDWFCDQIIVYDLKYDTEIVFVVEQWIALRLTFFPEATVTGASVSQVQNVKRIFLDNCILGLREVHTLLSIIMRHPRSEISRLQRISVLMCCIMSSMLCSIMFYSPQVDENEYSVGLRDFYISLQSLVISLLATVIVLFAFKRSYKYKHEKSQSTLQYRPSGYDEIDLRPKSERSVYSNFVRFVSRTMKGNPLIPAQLKQSEPVIFVRKAWRVVAWILCIGVIMICAFFIMLYGLKLGLVKSKIWLSSVLFTLSEDFFVSTPAKIILFSVLLSIAFQKINDNDNHRVKLKDLLSIKTEINQEQMEKILTKRRHPMYTPLGADFKQEMLRKQELRNNWWTLIDFTVALCFIFVISVMVFELWSSHYYNNSRIKAIMTKITSSENFFTFRTQSEVNTFLEDSFLRSLYITFWYNKRPITDKDFDREYWAEDYTHSLIGHQRYRQIRVSPVKCIFTFMSTKRKCLPHYNDDTEDTGDYASRWKPAQWHDIAQPNSAWKYMEASSSRFYTVYRLCGKSRVIFHNGGYLADLGPTKQMASSEARDLVFNNWQDQLTIATFVEFTLYNINMNLFSQVTMIVEYLISGTIELKAQVISVESKMKFGVWNGLFVGFVVYYVIRSGYLINRQGLMEYLTTSSRNRSRLIVVFLGTLSISLATIHYISSTTYYKHFITEGYGDTYFDFDSFIFYFVVLQDVLTFLLAVAIFRTILIFRGGRTLLNYFYTLTISLRWIFWLSTIICVFLLVQIPLIILLNMFSCYTIEEVVINLHFTRYFHSQCSELKYLQVFMCVKCLVVSIIRWYYVVIFMHYFRIAQTYKIKPSDKFNLILFVLDRLHKTKKTN